MILEAAMRKTFDEPNSEAVAQMNKLFNEIHSMLKKVNKDLVFEFGPVRDGRREFIVSADGIRSAFPAVRGLVAAAPDLPEWKNTAFRPGERVDYSMQTPNGKLNTDDIWFSARPEGPKLELDVYVKGITAENENQLGQAVFLMLDGVVGEYNVEMKIGSMEFGPLPADPNAHGLKPLRELPDIVDRY